MNSSRTTRSGLTGRNHSRPALKRGPPRIVTRGCDLPSQKWLPHSKSPGSRGARGQTPHVKGGYTLVNRAQVVCWYFTSHTAATDASGYWDSALPHVNVLVHLHVNVHEVLPIIEHVRVRLGSRSRARSRKTAENDTQCSRAYSDA
jgi:hypothetical protein